MKCVVCSGLAVLYHVFFILDQSKLVYFSDQLPSLLDMEI